MSDPFCDGMMAHARGLCADDHEYVDGADVELWQQGYQEGVRLRADDLKREREAAAKGLPVLQRLAARDDSVIGNSAAWAACSGATARPCRRRHGSGEPQGQ